VANRPRVAGNSGQKRQKPWGSFKARYEILYGRVKPRSIETPARLRGQGRRGVARHKDPWGFRIMISFGGCCRLLAPWTRGRWSRGPVPHGGDPRVALAGVHDIRVKGLVLRA